MNLSPLKADPAAATSTPTHDAAGAVSAEPTQPRLLDRVRSEIRTRHYALRTEQTYVHWIRRFILVGAGLNLSSFSRSERACSN